MEEIAGFTIEGHDGHNIAIVESKTTGKPIIVCHDCKVSLRGLVPCEVYSRVVGYLRPVKSWNKGKQEEFNDRKTYKNDKLCARPAPNL